MSRWIVIACLTCFQEEANSSSANSDWPKLRAVLETKLAMIESLEIEYSSYWLVDSQPRNEVRVELCAHGVKRSVSLWHLDAKTQEQDMRASHAVYDGENWDVLRFYFRRLEVSRRFAKPPYTDKIRSSAFFELLGWWPPGDSSRPLRPHGFPLMLNELLEIEAVSVLPDKVRIGDSICDVVDFQVGAERSCRLYIELDRCIVLRKEALLKGEVQFRADYLNFREVIPGVLLPFEIRRFLNHPNSESVYSVASYSVNRPDEMSFTLPREPGTLIVNRDTGKIDQIPGGFELIEKSIAFIPKTDVRARQSWSTYVPTFVAVGFALFVLFFEFRKGNSR
jgi:hypothetical protein